jgi:hypothetical protein
MDADEAAAGEEEEEEEEKEEEEEEKVEEEEEGATFEIASESPKPDSVLLSVLVI